MEIKKLTPARSPDRIPKAKEWRLRLSIPDGGFVKIEDEEFPFFPPESGYQPVLDFHFPSDRADWTDRISGQYYIAFGSPRLYGRIKIEAWSVGGVRLEYAINTEGQPYLEPKETGN